MCSFELKKYKSSINLIVSVEGDQPWDFFGRNDAKAETPVLWPPHVKSWLIGKDSDAGRDWGQEEKGTTEDEMAGWHHWPNGRESEWTPGVRDSQGGPACYDSWGSQRVGHDWATDLIWSDLMAITIQIYELFSTSYWNEIVNLKSVLISIFRKSKAISLQKQNIVWWCGY